MKKCFSAIILSVLMLQLHAAPSGKSKMIVSLQDGTQVEVTYWGDEFGCFYMDKAGRMLQPVGTGEVFRYSEESLQQAVWKVQQRKTSAIQSRIGANLPSKGEYKVPVILVQFKDCKFSVAANETEVKDFYDKYCNGTKDGKNYTGAGSYGAVRDYFIAQSDSTLFWDFQIVGPVTLDREYAFYGQDKDGAIDVNMASFYQEAVSKAMKLHSDWDIFDSNKDGLVDMVFFLYAGLGQANGGGPSTIWPKETVREMEVDGMKFSVSACCNELRKFKDGTMKADGIGIMCHEMSHVLGLPDFYNPRHDTFGMDYWSVMDYGYFAMNGYCPGGYNGYERDFMGWRNLIELKEPQTVRMRALEAGGMAYKIVNDKNPNEYYVLNNLQAVGWDQKLCTLGHGMIVTHVDYDEEIWNQNKVNDDMYHQRMTIIPANNKLIGNFNADSPADLLDALAGHPYPGTSRNTSLTNESTPAAEVYLGDFMNKPVRQIEEHQGIVSFKFMPLGILGQPVLDDAVETNTPFGFHISWPAVEHAEAYRIEYVPADDYMKTMVQTADSVRTCSIQLSGLKEGASYRYRVMALADQYENSPYSEWKTISSKVNSIDNVMPSDDTCLNVYSIQGVYLCSGTLAKVRAFLPEGLYVVSTPNYRGKLYIK